MESETTRIRKELHKLYCAAKWAGFSKRILKDLQNYVIFSLKTWNRLPSDFGCCKVATSTDKIGTGYCLLMQDGRCHLVYNGYKHHVPRNLSRVLREHWLYISGKLFSGYLLYNTRFTGLTSEELGYALSRIQLDHGTFSCK